MAACGTWSEYTLGCRCDECRRAAAEYQAGLRLKLRNEIVGDEDWHGSIGGYTNHQCRCSGCLSAMREYKQRWAAANREKLNAQARGRYAQQGESAKRAGVNYSSKRRARLAAAQTVSFTAEQLSQRWDYYGGRCWMCGAEATATDHVKPISKGGAHMLANLRPACGSCNSRKRNKWPLGVTAHG